MKASCGSAGPIEAKLEEMGSRKSLNVHNMWLFKMDGLGFR